MSQPSKIFLLITLVFLHSCTKDKAHVCGRTPQIKNRLERTTYKKCDQITPADLQQIKTLDLSKEGIEELKSGDFDGLSSLTKLNLDSNKIEVVKDSFEGLFELENLSMQFNNIHEIDPKAFSKLVKLKDLYLGGNKISEIPTKALENLKSLQVLDLSQNQIQNLPPDTFKGLNKLDSLNLFQNPLKLISKGAFNGLTSLSNLAMPPECKDKISENMFDQQLKKMPEIDTNSDEPQDEGSDKEGDY